MKQIIVDGMAGRLETLGVAREHLADAENCLERVEGLYRFAIKLIEDAMERDPAVFDARERLVAAKQIEEDAVTCVTKAAVSAWQAGFTNDKKEWEHENWQIRLRTIFTPTVTHIENFIAHLTELKATGVIKRLTLNRKATTSLHAAVKLNGLEIQEKTTCSVKRHVETA